MRDADPEAIRLEDLPEELDHEMAASVLLRLGSSLFGPPVEGDEPDPLEDPETRFRTLLEQMPAITFTANLSGGLNRLYVSPQVEELLGYSQEEWLSNPILWYRALHPDDRMAWNQEFARGCATGGPFRGEARMLTRSGEVVWIHGEARILKDRHGYPRHLFGVGFDISNLKRAEGRLQRSLAEKEVLLKEVHHRVKNNFQVTASLLRLQANRIEDPELRAVLERSRQRIRSMALVHEMLYKATDLAAVDMGQYARKLVGQIQASLDSAQRIRMVVDVQGVALGVDDAAPCGLILQEVIANAIEHAFEGTRGGTISVRGGPADDDGEIWMQVGDDGRGLPPELDLQQSDSLGLRLIRTLAGQLRARLEIENAPGATYRLTWSPRVDEEGHAAWRG